MKILDDMKNLSALLTEAENQAHQLGDGVPGAEHLVLAALLHTDESAKELLGVTAEQFRAAIVASHADALASAGISVEEPQLSPTKTRSPFYRSEASADEVLRRTRILAKKDGVRFESAYVVRAAAEREHGTVARALQILGIDRESLAQGSSRSTDS